jgi:hypothetical protein
MPYNPSFVTFADVRNRPVGAAYAEKSHKRAPDWPSWADFVCWTALERIGYLGVREFNAG